MIMWRLYYDGGASFDSSQGEASDAPAVGVVSIVQRNDCDHHPRSWLKTEIHQGTPRPIELFEGADWYWWRPDKGKWFRGDLMGFLDQAMNCGATHLKQGRCLTHEDWESFIAVIANDSLSS